MLLYLRIQVYLDKFLEYCTRETTRMEWSDESRRLQCAKFIIDRYFTFVDVVVRICFSGSSDFILLSASLILRQMESTYLVAGKVTRNLEKRSTPLIPLLLRGKMDLFVIFRRF